MAAKAKRRWYQFSLKALLILMAVASLPPGVFVVRRQYLIAKRLAEIEAVFQWLEGLDYPDIPNGRPVLVTTKDRDTHYIDRPGLAFLLNEDSTSFTILTLSLERKTIERDREIGESIYLDSTFEPTTLAAAAAASLERRGDIAYRDPTDPYSAEIDPWRQLLVLAWACIRHRHGEWAIKLFDAAEASISWPAELNNGRDLASAPFLENLANDFANWETRTTTLQCGSDKPRSELLKKFCWLKEHFPHSKYATLVDEKVAILQQMVAEDVAHAQQRATEPPFEHLPKKEQIEELIFQLRDHPPSYGCSVIEDPNAPTNRLPSYRYEAIPLLAAALGDKRLTRSVDQSVEYGSPCRVRTIGEIVELLLGRAGGRAFAPDPPIQDELQRIEATRFTALQWHQQLVTKGEQAGLIEAIREGGRHSSSLAWHLSIKHPDAACTAILEAASKADDEFQAGFSNFLGWIHTDESLPYLFGQLEHNNLNNRLRSAEALTNLGRSEGVTAMIEEWQQREMAELRWVGSFLTHSGRPEAIRAVTKRFSEQSIDQRAGTMYVARTDVNPKLATNNELRTAMIKLLLVALGDTEMRGEGGGYWGGPSIDGLRICDMAGYHLNQLDPARFPFIIEASLDQREQARGEILLSTRNR